MSELEVGHASHWTYKIKKHTHELEDKLKAQQELIDAGDEIFNELRTIIDDKRFLLNISDVKFNQFKDLLRKIDELSKKALAKLEAR